MSKSKLLVTNLLLILSACSSSDESLFTSAKTDKYICEATGSKIFPKNIRVIDGDTIEAVLLDGTSKRIRLLGIDSPEYNQHYGYQSTQTLQKCVNRGDVSVELHDQDKYKRFLGKVVADHTDCNFNQVQEGAAWHYKQYQSSQKEFDRFNYSNAEVIARNQGKGLWRAQNIVAPWDYRRGEIKKYQFNNMIYRLDSTTCFLQGDSPQDHNIIITVLEDIKYKS